MEVEVKSVAGSRLKQIKLPDELYAVAVNEHVLHSVVKGYLANKRQGTHATKTRSFVSGGGKKPFKQKGTGNARQGTSRSPLMPGGGTCHGPQPRDYEQKMNRKLRTLALKVAVSDRLRNNSVRIVDDFKIGSYSTKEVLKTLKNLGVQAPVIVDERKDDFLYRSARNIHGVQVISPLALNAEHVLRHDSIVITENAVNILTQRLEGKLNANAV